MIEITDKEAARIILLNNSSIEIEDINGGKHLLINGCDLIINPRITEYQKHSDDDKTSNLPA